MKFEAHISDEGEGGGVEELPPKVFGGLIGRPGRQACRPVVSFSLRSISNSVSRTVMAGLDPGFPVRGALTA